MIHEASTEDFPYIAEIYNLNTTIASHSNCDLEPVPFEVQLKNFGKSPTYVYRNQLNQVIGYAMVKKFAARPKFTRVAELAVYFRPGHRSAVAVGQLTAFAIERARGLGFKYLMAIIHRKNIASARGVEAFGFRQVAMFREIARKGDRWVDICWFQVDLELSGSSRLSQRMTPAGK